MTKRALLNLSLGFILSSSVAAAQPPPEGPGADGPASQSPATLPAVEGSPVQRAADSDELLEDVAAAAALMHGASKRLAYAQASCSTPRAAVEILLHWLQPERRNVQRAIQCVDGSRLSTSREVGERAELIKRVLDGRGLWVVEDRLPSAPDFEDTSGEHKYVLFGNIPEIYVERVGERWLWSAETIAAIPRLHAATFVLDMDSLVERLPAWMQVEYLGIFVWQLVALSILLVLAWILRTVVKGVVASQGKRLMMRVGAKWGEELLAQVGKPVGIMVAAGLVALILPALHLQVRVGQVLMLAIRVLAALSAVWTLYRVVDLFTAWLSQRADRTDTKLDDQLVPLIRRAIKLFILAIGAIFVLQNLNVNVGGLLAGMGLGGLAFALAAKDTVANLFGSATIFASRPFQIGDWVNIEGIDGTVESVGFRSTRLRTFYNSVVSIPNSKVADTKVDNYGARIYRRCKTMLGLTYDTTPEQMQAFVEGVRAVIQANAHTRKDFYLVHFYDYGSASLDVLVYFFFEVPTWDDEMRERHNVFLEIMRLARDIGVSFAFPTQTLHIESQAKPQELAIRELLSDEELAAVVASYGPSGERAHPGGPRITGGYYP